jgi:NAD(P)-dependent dehydrogenase (short-subunit alcohol dehydrogenase family)
MAAQLGNWNITVNCIAPGVTMTEATKKIVPDMFIDGMTQEASCRDGKAKPRRSKLTPKEFGILSDFIQAPKAMRPGSTRPVMAAPAPGRTGSLRRAGRPT